ncbi:MFS transporter [Longivirga aurantiaca]|uniref:MFS transporter n=1 Tax=Longivirga aurantiaca TaxID=1837743 RepID=A0ABW1T4F5_9ACTN
MRRTWLTRNLVVLTLVSLTQDAASELLYPLLPLLVTGVLAAPPVVLGIVEGAAEAAAGISKYVAGRWSDGRRRRPFVTTGYALAAAGKILVAAAAVWPMVLVGRVVDRLGKGVRSAPRDALIAASVPREHLGRAFGFHRTGDTLGAVIGPLIALAGLTLLDGDVRAVLWWAVVPAVLSVLLTFLVREKRRTPAPEAEVEVEAQVSAPSEPSPIPRSPLPRSFWRVVGVLVAIAVVNFPDALLLLRISDLGYSTTEVVLAYVVFNVVYTLGSYPAGALSDRLPRPVVYGVGLLAFGVAYGGLALVERGPWVWVLICVYGLFPALTDGVGKAWISTLVGDEHRGRAQGVFQSLSNAAVFLAGLWAGLLWAVGPGDGVLPLLVSGAVGLAAGAVLVIGRHRVTGVPQPLA